MHTKPFGQLLSSIRPLELGLVRCAAQSSAEVITLRLPPSPAMLALARALRSCLTASLRRHQP
eukprot:1952597-Pleurochrysis_carterae.AAC.1